MKPRKVNLLLEITTDQPIPALRRTRGALLLSTAYAGPETDKIAVVDVQQASASVSQPIPTAKPPKKGKKA